jgi:hypothetical protein
MSSYFLNLTSHTVFYKDNKVGGAIRNMISFESDLFRKVNLNHVIRLNRHCRNDSKDIISRCRIDILCRIDLNICHFSIFIHH